MIERVSRKLRRILDNARLFLEHPLVYILLLVKGRKLIVNCDFKNAEVQIAVDSFFELMNRTKSSRAETELVEYIEGIEPGSIFFDIGANVGTYSIFADKLGKEIKIYAFEPNAFTYAKLVNNVFINNCRNLKTVPIALFREPKYSVLNIPSDEIGTASCQFDDMTHKLKQANKEIYQGAFGFPVDYLIENFAFPRPNYVKIDVDGLEMAVLSGMERALSHKSLRQVFIEITRNEDAAIVDFLGRFGFNLQKRFDEAHPTIYNCLFAKAQ